MHAIELGPQCCSTLDEASAREWLVADGLGGFASGTAAGLRTRRYHGLLVVSGHGPGRMLALASLDPVLVLGDRRVRLATHEWASGAVAPQGYRHLESFAVESGVPRWRFVVGDVVLERELTAHRGRSGVGVVHRVVRAGGPVQLEIEALCTWRDAHGERRADGTPSTAPTADGFVFDGVYRVRGPSFRAAGRWYNGVHYRVEEARGLPSVEDLWFAGTFAAVVAPGGQVEIDAWADDLGDAPPPAGQAVTSARRRAAALVATAGATRVATAIDQQPADGARADLVLAADAFIVDGADGPDVVAGYPWFGSWSRDTMTSYEGLFLATGRSSEGRALLVRAASSLSQGMLANTADTGSTQYNTIDAALWYVHAVHRHVETTGDLDLAASVLPALRAIVGAYVAGTRYDIHVERDGLVSGGADGVALTWMDARVDGTPVTARHGKPVEVNALWVNALASLADLCDRTGADGSLVRRLEGTARASFARRFVRLDGAGLYDVVDGPGGDDASLRPNQLLALSLPFAPLDDPAPLVACASLLTPAGLRSLAPTDPSYRPVHRGGVDERDRAYHQGTVWPWLIGPYVDACRRVGWPVEGLTDTLVARLGDSGLGSVCETADGDAPHAATGCPFQAWSVAELLRVHDECASARW